MQAGFIIDHVVSAVPRYNGVLTTSIKDVTFLSDGERCYGNTLFKMCAATNWFMPPST